jgi:hypothetical protein
MMTPATELPPTLNTTPLRFLLSEGDQPGSDRVLLLPLPPGSGAEAIARSLIASVERGSWRLVPSPSPDGDVVTQRAWHRDLWLAMPSAVRDSVAAVIGPSATFLAPVLSGSGRTVVFIREPLAALALIGETVPKKRVLDHLEETSAADAPARLLRMANPQSRALLAPWHDPSELLISQGPPSDADRWREALFGHVLPKLEASAIDHAPGLARELARMLGGRQKPIVQAARAAAGSDGTVVEDSTHAELLLGLNWLDSELYERCRDPVGQSD